MSLHSAEFKVCIAPLRHGLLEDDPDGRFQFCGILWDAIWTARVVRWGLFWTIWWRHHITLTEREQTRSIYTGCYVEFRGTRALLQGNITGPNGIPIRVLKHLPQRAVSLLAHIFKAVLRTHHFPQAWKHARVISTLKPGKESGTSLLLSAH